jgi:hypothetical protein
MSRYLLFDSNCERCTKLAHEIERETDGWLTSRSLSDCRMQNLLQRTASTWQWRPTLLEVDDDRIQTFTGLRLGLRLLTGLGPRRTWRVARLAWEGGALESTLPPSLHEGRRNFLQMTGVAAAGIFLPFKGRSGQTSDDLATITDLPKVAAQTAILSGTIARLTYESRSSE